jgi:outer membrane protein TolC
MAHLLPETQELSLDYLVEQVLTRNPSLAQMNAAWQAASARFPQVTSWDDPMVGATVGPGSFGSNNVDIAYRLEVSQKIPYPGKLGLRGQAALAEAQAAGREVEDTRLHLIEGTKDAFYEYFLVERALEVNADRRKRLTELRQNAVARVTNTKGPQQDILLADVEIANQAERQLDLEQKRRIVQARLNTLLHLPSSSPLEAPPKRPASIPTLPPLEDLQAAALAQRPDLQVLNDRIAADQAALALAYKDYCPDFEVMAAYDAFWQGVDRPLQAQVGLRVNLPVYKARRFAAVAEAQARLAQRRFDLERLTDLVNFQVQEAYEKARKSRQTATLYEKSILPAAQANIKEAIAAYGQGKIPFLTLVEAQRNLDDHRDRYYEALADSYRRLAALERVVGRALE